MEDIITVAFWIGVLASGIRLATPYLFASIGETLGFEIGDIAALSPQPASYNVKAAKPLFPRREKEAIATGAPPRGATGAPQKGAQSAHPFSKLEIRVGLIEEARDHPDADTLFALTVNLGTETRPICAGLREHLQASDLCGKKVVVLANLKPIQLRGIESRGMILATDRKDGKVVPVDPGDAKLGELVTVEGIESRPKKKLSMSDFEKAPLEMVGGVVTHAGIPLRTGAGPIRCDAEDGAKVR